LCFDPAAAAADETITVVPKTIAVTSTNRAPPRRTIRLKMSPSRPRWPPTRPLRSSVTRQRRPDRWFCPVFLSTARVSLQKFYGATGVGAMGPIDHLWLWRQMVWSCFAWSAGW
jgi:hypothetical protein